MEQYTDSRIYRSLESFICERTEINDNEFIFRQIVNQTFVSELPEIVNESLAIELEKKYNTVELNLMINNFKKKLIGLYNEKEKLSSKLNFNQKCFSDFIVLFNKIYNNEIEPELIDNIKIKLNLKELSDEYQIKNEECSFLKKSILNLSSVLNPTLCQICFENQITNFMEPCGHTICEMCKCMVCPFCNVKIFNIKKLYL
jgi:hypothetical protein